MQLENLHIYRTGYGDSVEYAGSIKFSGKHGDISLKLKPEHINGLLVVVAKGMTAASREVAQELTADIIEHAQGQLEDKAEDDIPFQDQ